METLGKYGPLEKLSDVPMGAVYKAFDGSRMRYVTLRTLGSDIEWDPALKKRFCDECRVLIGQRHPNLAAVYEQGQEQNIAYVVTELLPGRNLKMLIAEKAAMTVEQKFAIMIQAAAGLCHAHSLGVLHRNLQPHSIEILPDGRAKIADFGVGGLLSSPGAPVSAQSESRIYLAPEQLLGKEATCQSDVFSLGLIFYEFLTGTHPFYDSDSSKTLDNILYKTHFPTVEQFPEVPFALWPIVERCLAKDAEERYAGMLDFSTACQAALDELAEDSQWMRIELQTTLPRLQKAARKHAAPPALAKLQSEVEHALFNEDKSDYQSLSRLVAALAEQHRLLETSSEATFPSLPEPADTPPGKDSITVDEGTMSAEASAGVPDSKETCTPAPCTPGLPLQSGAADFPAMMDSGFAPFAAAAGSREKSEAETTEPPAPARDENLSLPGLPLPSCGPAPAESFVARHPSGELPRMGGTRKESVSELLRKIDQGQDSTRKTVEKFLAGRQAMATTGTQKSPETALAGTASAGAQREACEPKREATPAAVTPGTDREQPQQPAAHARTGKDHASRARLPIEGVEGVPRGFSRQDLRRATLWISAAVLVLILAVAVPTWVRNRFGSNAGRNIFALGQRATGMVPSRTSGKSSDRTVDALRSRLDFTRQDILLQEAQILRSIGRLGESKVFLKRLIEIYPTYLPAQQELDQIEAATSPPKNSSSRDQDNQQQTVQKLLASAASAINTGKLPRAMSDLDKADQMQPGLVEVANLRRRLEAKKAELAASTTRQQEEQLAAQRQNESEALIRRTDELYRQGKYDEALAAVEERLAQDPELPRAQELRSSTIEVQRSLKAYQSALEGGKYAEARAALDRLERINPADPDLPALRKRAETPPAPGSASLTMYALAEPSALLLDDQPVGTGGELINHALSAGRHKLLARNSAGREVVLIHEFPNGQSISMVYDVAGQILRPMVESDRELMRKSKARQQAHRFAVEHSHGLFRGSCKGDLILDYYHIVYQPTTGSHGFSVPFKDFKLRVEDKTAVLLHTADSKEFSAFRLADAGVAQTLKKLWDDLTALDK